MPADLIPLFGVIGDTLKDTSGPSRNIVSLVIAGLL